jgi:hypothetical protein
LFGRVAAVVNVAVTVPRLLETRFVGWTFVVDIANTDRGVVATAAAKERKIARRFSWTVMQDMGV